MRTSRRGFTLAELIVAITATVLVASATVGILRGLSAARERALRQMTVQQEARIAIGAIATALRNSLRTQDTESRLGGIDDSLDAEMLPATWDTNMEYPADRLRVFTVSQRSVRSGERESDVRECEFFLATPEAGEPPMLMQRIDPTRNEQPDGGGVVLAVAHNVMGLDLSYHNGVEWLREWDAEQQSLPLAVRIRLVMAADADGRHRWPISRIVNLPYPVIADEEGSGDQG